MSTNDNNKNSKYPLDEVISPMFGHDYKNRIVLNKEQENYNKNSSQEINYLEKQITQELEEKQKEEKEKIYQESYKSNTDVLKEYQKQKEQEEIKATLPSNYLNFRDNLEKTNDLSIISDFDTSVSNDTINNTISEIVSDIFDYQTQNNHQE